MRGTVFDRVRALVERLSGEPLCDDCIADRLALTVRQHANHKTRQLAANRGFERQLGECSLCGATKKVTRQKGRRPSTSSN
jgi:hypothetical protein